MSSRLSKLFPKLFSYGCDDSYVATIRRRRFRRLQIYLDKLCANTPRPIKMLDIGGGFKFWEQSGFPDPLEYSITLLNHVVPALPENIPGFSVMKGDARELGEKECQEFDIAFSNSVIEHVGEDEDQKKMADSILKNFDKYIVQTPNFWFPFEPHSQIPFFQYIPHFIRGGLIFVFGNITYFPRKETYKECVSVSKSTRMLTKRKLKALFPKAKIITESLFGLPKSFIVIGGFDEE